MRVGSLVELVDDNWGSTEYTPIRPVKNKIYTVRDFNTTGGLYLEEIISEINPYFDNEQGFLISRFRELQPPITISIESILQQLT